MTERGFSSVTLDQGDVRELMERARRARGHVLTMTTLAASGHPGGSMSSMEIYLLLYHHARLRPEEPDWQDRDRVIVSHGHTSPGAYVALADAGFFEMDDLVAHFRQAGSPFEGHVEHMVPGIEWSTGNLGQGLSAGVGSALAARLTGRGWHTYVAMSDAEQMKGQVGEARRLAAKYGLADITVVVDRNHAQISGHTEDVMPVDVAAGFAADGWRVIETDGHDVAALYSAIAEATADRSGPCAVIARTVIGKGVSFMEDDPQYHGRGLTPDEYSRAISELGLDPGELERARQRRPEPPRTKPAHRGPAVVARDLGEPRDYTREKDTDNRSASGAALADVAEANAAVPMAVLDCDLVESVKTGAFAESRPDAFIECGVGEHNAATVTGFLSVSGVLAVWADFGVFGLDEVYNQQRLNDINEANVKLLLTHCGLDVGEDGRTHHCIDYVGALRDFFGWKVVVPADPNQTDRAVRAALAMPGNVAVCMGRSKLPVILSPDGRPAFGGSYEFRYGASERVREGADGAVLAMGTLAGAAVDAADALSREGVSLSVDVVACPLDLDDDAMGRLASAPLVVTVEDHSVRTGLAAGVSAWLASRGEAPKLLALGVERYSTSGRAADLFSAAGLDAGGIASSIRAALRR